MRRLLRLFPAFRALEVDLELCRDSVDELSTEKLLLQDRLEAALSDKEQLWKVMQESLTNERSALRMQVNHAVQRSGGGVPYPDAHSLPPSIAHLPQESGPVGRRGRILPSEAVQQRNQQFVAELIASKGPRVANG